MSKQRASKLPINSRYGIKAISWSDLISIETDPKGWLAGKRLKATPAMEYGTSIHAEIKHRKIKDIPVGNAPEKTYSCLISKGLMIVGTPDDTDDETIYEYKTSRKLWTKKQAEEHGQLFTYALLKWKTTGILPKRALLISLETRYDEECGIVLTGNRVTHEVPIKMIDVLKVQTRFIKAVKLIQQCTK